MLASLTASQPSQPICPSANLPPLARPTTAAKLCVPGAVPAADRPPRNVGRLLLLLRAAPLPTTRLHLQNHKPIHKARAFILTLFRSAHPPPFPLSRTLPSILSRILEATVFLLRFFPPRLAMPPATRRRAQPHLQGAPSSDGHVSDDADMEAAQAMAEEHPEEGDEEDEEDVHDLMQADEDEDDAQLGKFATN